MIPMNEEEYYQRRNRFLDLMDEGIAILCSAPLQTRSNDTEHPYRQESNFFYLSGIEEDETLLLFEKRAGVRRSYLFVKDPNPEESLWVGARPGVALYRARCRFDEILDITEYEGKLSELLKEMPRLYCDLFSEDARVVQARLTCKILLHARGVNRSPRIFCDVHEVTQKMRLLKSEAEVAQICAALEITKAAHHRAMAVTQAGSNEFEIEAELAYAFAKGGTKALAYESIVAGGNRANTLHYIDNDKILEAGSLVLIDAGCELGMYASDITRTFPVSGTFSPAQKELYEMVLEVQLSVIAMIRPGITKRELQEASEKMLCEGMIRLGILTGEREALMDAKVHKKYFPHGIGHWMGLDVHDPCPYVDEKGEPLLFEPGMVLTIEPGIYIREEDAEVPLQYRGIGIRIEDNILVTETGYRNLSEGIAKSVAEIEAACSAYM